MIYCKSKESRKSSQQQAMATMGQVSSSIVGLAPPLYIRLQKNFHVTTLTTHRPGVKLKVEGSEYGRGLKGSESFARRS
jgi:hypothetical protein